MLTLTFQGVENSSDVALYSGLAAGVVTVVLLIIAVTLYRRSQSEYGVDVIDSSALTGGFQSFSFKTSRQGEPVTLWCPPKFMPRSATSLKSQWTKYLWDNDTIINEFWVSAIRYTPFIMLPEIVSPSNSPIESWGGRFFSEYAEYLQ